MGKTPLFLILVAGEAIAQNVCSCMFIGQSQPSGVSIRFEGAASYVPARLYSVVQSNDQLKVDPSHTAMLACDGGVRTTLPGQPPLQSVPCQRSASVPATITDAQGKLRFIDRRTLTALDESEPLTVLSPMLGALKNGTPPIRFVPKGAVEDYDLEILGATDGSVWKKPIRATITQRVPRTAKGCALPSPPARHCCEALRPRQHEVPRPSQLLLCRSGSSRIALSSSCLF
jgi:hypothetical protein